MSVLQGIPDASKLWSWQEPTKVDGFTLTEGDDPWDTSISFKLPSIVARRSEIKTRFTGKPLFTTSINNTTIDQKDAAHGPQLTNTTMFSTGTLKRRDGGAQNVHEPEAEESEDSDVDDTDDEDDEGECTAEGERYYRRPVRTARVSTGDVDVGTTSFLLATGLGQAESGGHGTWQGHVTFNSVITSSALLTQGIIGCGFESGKVALTRYADASLTKLGQFTMHEAAIRDMSPCATHPGLFATGSCDNTMCLWDMAQLSYDKEDTKALQHHASPMATLILADDEVVTSLDWRNDVLISSTIDLQPSTISDAPALASASLSGDDTPSGQVTPPTLGPGDSSSNWMSTATTIVNGSGSSGSGLDVTPLASDASSPLPSLLQRAKSDVWEEGARYALFDTRLKLSGNRPAIAKTTGRRGLLCVKHLSDWEVLLGFESGLLLALDLRKTEHAVQVVKDPYVSAVATIEVNPSCTRFVTAGVTDTTIWSNRNPNTALSSGPEGGRKNIAAPVYHTGESSDRIETEEFLITNGSFMNDATCVLTNHHGVATLVMF